MLETMTNSNSTIGIAVDAIAVCGPSERAV